MMTMNLLFPFLHLQVPAAPDAPVAFSWSKSPVANSKLQHHSDTTAPQEAPKSSEHTSSMTQPTTPEKTPERKPSCWARTARRIEQPAQGWDDGTQDLSRRSYATMKRKASQDLSKEGTGGVAGGAA